MADDEHESAGSRVKPARSNAGVALGTFPWRFFFGAVIAVAVAIGVTRFRVPNPMNIPAPSSSRVEVRPTPNVITAIRDLARLESVTFHMQKVVDIRDQQSHLWGLVNQRDALLLIAAADVVAGVDLAGIRPQDVVTDWKRRRVELTLPPAEVFSAALDETQTRVYRRETDTFASRREDLEERARREATSTMRRDAEAAGILTRARSSVERSVRSLLHSLGFEDIQIRWREAP